MANEEKPKAKGTWGKRDPRTASELNVICKEFFEKLVVPEEWKFMRWQNVIDKQMISIANPNGTLISVGKVYRDMRTSGIDLMEYRVCFLTFSERGGICEKSIVDYGKFKYHTIVTNKTIDKLNAWISDHYKELPLTPSADGEQENKENDPDDGLQHFRDRYEDRTLSPIVDSGK
jgi:hypothetical protein